MNINIRKLLVPLVTCAISFFIISTFTSIGMIYMYKDGKVQVQKTVDTYHYVFEEQKLSRIITEAGRYNRIYTMYSEIHADHGQKYHSSFNTEKESHKQGLKKQVRTKFFRLDYEYSRITGNPYFGAISFAVKESAMNPSARTYKEVKVDIPEVVKIVKKGKKSFMYIYLELGIFQFRKEAIDHAWGVVTKDMPPELSRIFSFTYNVVSDMFDPINALKVMHILMWDARHKFNGDPSWWVPAIHWGIGRIYKYYIDGVPLPHEFRFNKGTVREFARDPLNYYGVWNAYCSQFEKFTTEIFIDKSWLAAYERECSKMEWNFIYTHKYVKKIIYISDRMDKREQAHKLSIEKYKVKQDKDRKLYQRRLKKVDDEYRKLIGIGKAGKVQTWKSIFEEGFNLFKGLAAEARAKEVDKIRRIIITALLVSCVLILLLAVGMVIIIVRFFLKRKCNVK